MQTAQQPAVQWTEMNLPISVGPAHLVLRQCQPVHAAALAHGGRDNGAPGERPYHPGYYAAFVIDPDGNNIEAVYHGPARRSAESVEVTF